jgi:hypothetical protein
VGTMRPGAPLTFLTRALLFAHMKWFVAATYAADPNFDSDFPLTDLSSVASISIGIHSVVRLGCLEQVGNMAPTLMTISCSQQSFR